MGILIFDMYSERGYQYNLIRLYLRDAWPPTFTKRGVLLIYYY